MQFRVWVMPLLACVGVVLSNGRTGAADFAAEGSAFASDVFGVATVNLDRLDLPAAVDEFIRLSMIPAAEAEQAKQIAAGVQKQFDELPKLGAKRLFVYLRASDIVAGGTTWGVETDSPESAAAVRDWLKDRLAEIKLHGDLEYLVPPTKVIKTEGRFVIGGPSEERLKAVIEAPKTPRPELQSAYESLLKADAGVLIFGDADGRRVVRELFPQMPAPFMEVNGKLLADGIASASVTVKFPPEPVVTVSLDASDNAAGDVLAQVFDKARTALGAFLTAEMMSGPEAHRTRAVALLPMVAQLKLEREGTRLRVAFGDDDSEIAFLRNLLPALTQQARDAAYRSSRMNNFKQITLGMLNYESARKHLPTQAIYSKEGKPLLSWRVAILPYMGEMALYEQFKLDEPWDSEHNRKLIEQMPAVYADPDPNVRTGSGAGKTTYLSTAGEGLFFEGVEPRTWRSITDGTSNTAWLLEAAPERAVQWTKPEDLQDLDGVLERNDRDWFTVGFVDGHVRALSTKNEASDLKALLTPAGEEVIDVSKLK